MSTGEAEGKSWAEMSPAERRASRFEQWLAAEGAEFASPEAEADFRARVERFRDVVEFRKVPDRVPVMVQATFMPADLYDDVTPYDLMYDASALKDTMLRYLRDYQPDYYFTPVIIGSGQVFEILDYKQGAWPGHGVPKESGYQYIEGEYMRDEDYRALIDDPTDFWIRRFMPRVFGALKGFEQIPAFTDLWEIAVVTGHMIPFGLPDVQTALEKLAEAGRVAFEWAGVIGATEAEARNLGYANCAGGLTKAPFDLVADTLRGTRSTMLDMRRRPELLLEAIARMTPLAIKQGVAGATMNANPVVFIPLHKGADGFMSDEQFRTFYWPTLKEVVNGLVEEGCVPFLFVEGGYNSRLEYLAEIPPGSSFCLFDHTDMARAKEVLRDKVCIGGNVPASLVVTGTPDEMKAYCKELIDTVADGGGFILSTGVAMDEGTPENVHALIDFTKEYGVYGA